MMIPRFLVATLCMFSPSFCGAEEPDVSNETMMLNAKALSAALLCLLLGTGSAFCCCQGPGPNPPPNVYNDYKYEFFTLPKGAGSTLTVINNLDVVAGTYYPTGCCAAGGSGMGYLRYPDGKIVIFTIANATAISMTITGLNDRGELVGHYTDKTTNNTTGFIRYPDGKIKTFALGGATVNTIPTGINNEGNVIGVLADNNQSVPTVAFLRYPDGQYLTYGVPDASWIFTMNINDQGVALGDYFCPDSEGSVCGFYGKPGGKVETFSYPPNGIEPSEINNGGVIAGVADLGKDYFIRKPDGKMILFGLNKVANLFYVQPQFIRINDEDEVIGVYTVLDPTYPSSPYSDPYSYDIIRSPDGKISYYDPPNSPGGLWGHAINNRGVIAGQDLLASGGFFLLTPKHCK